MQLHITHRHIFEAAALLLSDNYQAVDRGLEGGGEWVTTHWWKNREREPCICHRADSITVNGAHSKHQSMSWASHPHTDMHLMGLFLICPQPLTQVDIICTAQVSIRGYPGRMHVPSTCNLLAWLMVYQRWWGHFETCWQFLFGFWSSHYWRTEFRIWESSDM